jgi:molybdopterin-guanine dinucleotide biosynthesis protein MobB
VKRWSSYFGFGLWKYIKILVVLASVMGELAVVGVYGFSKTGKTMLLEDVIQRLTGEGLRIATIKCTDEEISLDTPGKDTSRHREAGSSVSVLSSPHETGFVFPARMPVHAVADVLADSGFGEIDLLLVEGANEAWIPKIMVGECPEREHTIGRCSGDVEEALKMIHGVLQESKYTRPLVTITVNGKEIPLTEYPELVISKVLLGMLSSLKGVGEVQSARFTLTCCPPHKE